MAKKKKKKAIAVARSEMAIMSEKNTILLKESYSTIRRRLLDAQVFVEVSSRKGSKILINKMVIEYVRPID